VAPFLACAAHAFHAATAAAAGCDGDGTPGLLADFARRLLSRGWLSSTFDLLASCGAGAPMPGSSNRYGAWPAQQQPFSGSQQQPFSGSQQHAALSRRAASGGGAAVGGAELEAASLPAWQLLMLLSWAADQQAWLAMQHGDSHRALSGSQGGGAAGAAAALAAVDRAAALMRGFEGPDAALRFLASGPLQHCRGNHTRASGSAADSALQPLWRLCHNARITAG
jgi:hypothetical protein